MDRHPYRDLDREAVWRTAVCELRDRDPSRLYRPKWRIDKGFRIAIAGSCFAQYVGEHLRARGFTVLDLEPPPPDLPAEESRAFGYSTFSARYGVLYTPRQMLQLAQEALGERAPQREVWERRGRFFDALRPAVEPYGLDSPDEVLMHREWHISKVRELLLTADLFIFTLGMTEAWVHRATGTVFPSAPGVIAGEYQPELHLFEHFGYQEVLSDLSALRTIILSTRGERSSCRFLLTVSPVPLTATASEQHVLCATIEAKSVLRAVASELVRKYPDVDYFPAYEIIASPWNNGRYYTANQRTVSNQGVAAVMQAFFAEHGGNAEVTPMPPPSVPVAPAPDGVDDSQCVDALLDSFSK